MLSGCSTGLEDVTTACKQKGGCAGVAAKENDKAITAQLATSVALSATERAALFRGEVLQFRSLTERFCKKLSETRSQCPASQLLVPPNPASAEVACKVGEKKVADGVFRLKVQAEGGGGKFSLVANGGKIFSSSVSGNDFQNITWSNQNGQTILVRFVDLASLELKDEEVKFGGNITADNINQFELSIDGKSFLNKSHLASRNGRDKLQVKVDHLVNLRNSSSCTVTQKFLDDSAEAAKSYVEGLPPAERYKDLSEDEAKQKLLTLESELPLERQRKQYASDSLGFDPNLGCWQDVTLKDFKIELNGGPGDDNGRREVDNEATQPRKGEGSATSYTFQLSDTLKINAINNEGNAIFKGDGKLEKKDFVGETTAIGSLRFLKIRKNGFSFETTSQKKCNRGFLGIFGGSCVTRFNNSETNITKLNRLRVFVNGQLAYDRDGIDHTFNMNRLEYLDMGFRDNSAWKTLVSRSDCKAFSGPK